jgi:hypothetical protein
MSVAMQKEKDPARAKAEAAIEMFQPNFRF